MLPVVCVFLMQLRLQSVELFEQVVVLGPAGVWAVFLRLVQPVSQQSDIADGGNRNTPNGVFFVKLRMLFQVANRRPLGRETRRSDWTFEDFQKGCFPAPLGPTSEHDCRTKFKLNLRSTSYHRTFWKCDRGKSEPLLSSTLQA